MRPIELLDLLDAEERDAWQPPKIRKALRGARFSAYVFRKLRKRRSAGNLSERQKSAARSHNRHVDYLARKIILAAKRKRSGKIQYEAHPPSALMAKRKESILLDGLHPKRTTSWASIPDRLRLRSSIEIDVERFCFLTNPVGTIQVLKSICEAESTHLSGRINFLDERCLDIGPWLVLSNMRPDLSPMFSGGLISNSMSKVIDAVGLTGPLQFAVSPSISDERDIWAFPLRSRRLAGSSRSPTQHIDPQAAEKVGGDLCVAINEWLGACVDHELTISGSRCVKKIVGETLDNAERHGRREHANDGDWSLTGFMAKREGPDGPLFRCQLSFLNIGAPISETILDAPTRILEDMNHYTQNHSAEMGRHRHPEKHLRTIFALQDTVTRDHDAVAEGRGGTGFRDIICLFSDLANFDKDKSDAKLGIVSGRTCLHIEHKRTLDAYPEPNALFNLWLNDDNNRLHPPSNSAVFELESDFCGTLITMGFTLDPGFLEQTSDDSN